jgi:hypothetical protein
MKNEKLLTVIKAKVVVPPPTYRINLSADAAARLHAIISQCECGALGEELEQLWREMRNAGFPKSYEFNGRIAA